MTDRPVPDFTHETALFAEGYAHVAGVDEVGRGPLAGPVTAAAVILDPARIPAGIDDSKRLTERRREEIYEQLCAEHWVSVAQASVAEIDEINILQASHLAMCRAIEGLARKADFVLVDGNRIPKALTLPARAIVKGDARVLSIGAASIVAKIARDQVMRDLAQHYPGYGWERNAGYPTPTHKQALQDLGVTPHHRRSFAPVRSILCREQN
ncbi:ribonuclease HII [Pseudooceanicola sp. CBS1P-1]|uniref:Ribonuclease HII n=1 Tax=Pseudooceanicola albus TaxID=2692189 RepID=A0A6L7FZ92_9RHOB|nr:MULTISPECIES: ribonuclease HII [Pseudooceanicola]MBT9384010.1 ribonuclease HII [Pseudooceanicola endophyticus]MXN16578.1 ribonuclease HII [Pseudooceanicola albus]